MRFGLLAHSGASYPASGVHIAGTTSDVILAFSASCLSASLVWFLHDRKMIVHMTDDIKELCSMTAVSAGGNGGGGAHSSANGCLYGPGAEIADCTASPILPVGLQRSGHVRQHPVGVRPRLIGRVKRARARD